MNVNAEGRLPLAMDKTEAYALYAIFRDFARQINALTDDVMPKANHSAAITADALVKTGQAVYRGFTITTATATALIEIRDGIAAGGGVVIDTIPLGTAAGTRVEKTVGIVCETGLYVDYAATATGTLVLHFE